MSEGLWPAGAGEMRERVRGHPWAGTPLGPIAQWPQSLRSAVDACLASGFASFVWWGPELVQLYNDAAIPLLRARHPDALGRPARESWAEVWPVVGPVSAQVLRTGQAAAAGDLPTASASGGPPGEAALTLCFSAVRDEGGGIAGVMAIAVETAGSTRAAALRESQARQAFLLRLSDRVRSLSDAGAIMAAAAEAFARHLGLSVVQYLVVDPDGDGYRVAATYAAGRLPRVRTDHGRISHHGPGWGPRFRAGQDVFWDDHDARPGDAGASSAFGIRSGSAVPLVKEGRLVAVFCSAHPQPRRWTETEKILQREVAERTWDAVERARAEAALRESEEKYRALFTSMDEAYAVVEGVADETGRWHDFLFLEVNPAFVEHTAMPHPVGRTATQLLGAPNPRWAELYGRVARTGVPMRLVQPEDALGRVFDLNIFRLGGAESRRVAVLFTNITERRRAEAALRESEARLRRMGNVEGVGVLTFDHAGTLLSANDAFLAMLGYRRGEFEARTFTWRDFTPPEYVDQSARQLERLVSTERVRPYEKEYFRKDGSRVWMMFVGANLGDGTLVEYAIDITPRKRAEAALRESEARLQAAMAAGRMAWWDWDPATDRVVAAGPMADLYGLPPGERWESRAHGFGLVHPDDADRHRTRILAAARDGAGWHSEFRVIRPRDGAVAWLEERAETAADPVTGTVRVTGLVWDITERKRADEALRELNDSLERRVAERTAELASTNTVLRDEVLAHARARAGRDALLLQLTTVQEEERRRISRELHDQIGQLVTALQLGLRALRPDENDAGRVRELERLAGRIAREMQHLALELRHPALDSLGLAPALRAHLEDWGERHGLECDFHTLGLDGDRLPPEVETALYRVVQEGLTNVLKHAGARRVSLVLERRDGWVRAVLEDDGRGFDADAAPDSPAMARRLGLRGMRERLALLGGALEVESAAGQGTTLFARVPLAAATERDGADEG